MRMADRVAVLDAAQMAALVAVADEAWALREKARGQQIQHQHSSDDYIPVVLLAPLGDALDELDSLCA